MSLGRKQRARFCGGRTKEGGEGGRYGKKKGFLGQAFNSAACVVTLKLDMLYGHESCTKRWLWNRSDYAWGQQLIKMRLQQV